MTWGDILEWLAGAGLTYAAYIATNKAWVAVVVACIFLIYQAQCWAATPLQARKKPGRTIQRVGQPKTKPTLRDHWEGLKVRLYIMPRQVRARLRHRFRKHQKPTTEVLQIRQPTVEELLVGLDQHTQRTPNGSGSITEV